MMTRQRDNNLEELTAAERLGVWKILDAVIGDGKVSFDKDMGTYNDDGDIVICLDRADYLAAKRAYNKLLAGISFKVR